MESNENVSRWVDDRLASLTVSSQWRPDAARGLARLRKLEHRRMVHHFRFVWASAAAMTAAGCVAAILFRAQPACAKPFCAGFLKPAAIIQNYKESGVATAPLTCEIYTDYECPHCAEFYRDTVPK